ncbi:hypothetical protein GCM10023168_02030 [Fodinibacter luteus]|uniref:Uncharacterized protein n=1 Tax=Fodinibacter luteus TaxID=552064 RepID=A0ABP8JWY3_9MICO
MGCGSSHDARRAGGDDRGQAEAVDGAGVVEPPVDDDPGDEVPDPDDPADEDDVVDDDEDDEVSDDEPAEEEPLGPDDPLRESVR